MRTIRFRGKNKETGEWVIGSLLISKQGVYIVPLPYINHSLVEVDENSVGKYTDLKDKNGTKIYEGDIIGDKNGIGVVLYKDGILGIASYSYGFEHITDWTAFDHGIDYPDRLSIMGNIYDNPELLNE